MSGARGGYEIFTTLMIHTTKEGPQVNGELMPLVNGSTPVTRNDREVARRAKRETYDKVREAGFAADGAFALAGHIMEGYARLDAHRQSLAGNDPGLNNDLDAFQLQARQQALSIQRNAFTERSL